MKRANFGFFTTETASTFVIFTLSNMGQVCTAAEGAHRREDDAPLQSIRV